LAGVGELVCVTEAQSGDLGYTQGTETYTITDPKTGKPMSDRGKWLTIRKKQADGTWKIVQDAWNSDMPLSNPSN
jgi:ketosteroid isomerase-like protein